MKVRNMTKIILWLLCLIVALVVVLLTAAALPPALVATTWTVDHDGPAHFSTIQDAIDAASAGDTIMFAPGSYYENMTIETIK